MKLLVIGGQGYTDQATVWAALDRLDKRRTIMLLVTHGNPGAQALATAWAVKHGAAWLTVPAGQAWPLVAPDGAVAFPDDDHPDTLVDAEAGKAKVWRPVAVEHV